MKNSRHTQKQDSLEPAQEWQQVQPNQLQIRWAWVRWQTQLFMTLQQAGAQKGIQIGQHATANHSVNDISNSMSAMEPTHQHTDWDPP